MKFVLLLSDFIRLWPSGDFSIKYGPRNHMNINKENNAKLYDMCTIDLKDLMSFLLC